MWPFRRRKVGRHELGAAVTAIPALPRRAAPAYVAPAAPAPEPPAAPGQAVPAPPPSGPAGSPEAPYQGVVAPPATPAPRVELGFRDGSTAALAPGSEQAKALTDIASVLTRRD
jgi:hypothetical protein